MRSDEGKAIPTGVITFADSERTKGAKTKVIGVGGAGGTVVNHWEFLDILPGPGGLADALLYQEVRGYIVASGGLINVDFAKLKAIVAHNGFARVGMGEASGKSRAIEAAGLAIASPLPEGTSIISAKVLLVFVTGGADVTLFEISEAMDLIQKSADPDANIIYGAAIDERVTGEIRITVIATNFSSPTSPSVSGHNAPAILLKNLSSESDALMARMQTSKARKAIETAFNASSGRLGRAAVKAARKRRRHREPPVPARQVPVVSAVQHEVPQETVEEKKIG